jgi:hypothetical protein
MQDDLEAEKVSELDEEDKQRHEPEAKKAERGEVHLRDLKDECPLKPVNDHDSRYADIILFLLEKQTPERFTLDGDEEHETKVKVSKDYNNWNSTVISRYFVADEGSEHSESHLRQKNAAGQWLQVPFAREVKAICDKVFCQDPNHLAVKPMMHKLKKYKLTWHNMKADVKPSIQSCTICYAGERHSDQVVRTNHTIHCKKPFELFQADLLTLADEHGAEPPIKYLLVIIDYFSRYAWVAPITTKHSSHVSEMFNEVLESLPQQPSIVQTDNGGEFQSPFSKLVLAKSIKLKRTEPRRPQTNGAVERLNQTLKDKLTERRLNKAKGGQSWNLILDLQQIVTHYNDTIHSTTGQRPIDLLYETGSDVLNLVGQHIKRQRKVEAVDESVNEEGNPNVNLRLGDYVGVRNDIVFGGRHWVRPKLNKFKAEQGITYNIAGIIKMTYALHAQVDIFPPPNLLFESTTINVV